MYVMESSLPLAFLWGFQKTVRGWDSLLNLRS